ncbi:hypothetical protein GQ600_3802 [Phytophthora cactorum]|nr:hypothetical protein GQ600_3802 [Phytophthora cactorum]
MTIDPTEAMESVKLMQKLENEFKDTGDSTDNGSASEEDVPQTQPSKPLQKGQEHDTPSTKAQETAETNPREPPKASEHTPGKSARQVDIINVPKPLRRGKARTQLKQLRAHTRCRPACCAQLPKPSNCVTEGAVGMGKECIESEGSPRDVGEISYPA